MDCRPGTTVGIREILYSGFKVGLHPGAGRLLDRMWGEKEAVRGTAGRTQLDQL